MIRKTHISLAISQLFAGSALAQTIEGTIADSTGALINGAKVELIGSNRYVITNPAGKFLLDSARDGKVELHISAVGFAHFNHMIDVNDQTQPLRITLNRTPIETIDIKASLFHASQMESATPISVLGGEALRQQQSATLGDTLEKQVGVHSNFHAGVASTPIIRGLSGPRVLVAQNGLDVSDVSRVGPDHSVATEASTAQQIEVLRGPATLFFGSGAIGGVVNVVDQRVPTNSQSFGEFIIEKDSVNQQKLGAFNVKTGTQDIAVYADGFWRESDDYRIPKAPSLQQAIGGHVENSAEESNGFTLGTSYLLDNGFIGVSAGKLNREYGIPGHTHGKAEEHGHEYEHDEMEPETLGIYADLGQTRYQLIGELNFDHRIISAINFKGAYTDYQHSEIEAGATGTMFSNKTKEFKTDLLHHPMYDWRGGLSFHVKQTAMKAIGAEAFSPPSQTDMFAVAMMQERHLGDVLIQLGGRIERVTIDAPNVRLPNIGTHSHDEHDHAHAPEQTSAETRRFSVDHKFTPITLSTGLVWDFTTGYNLALSFTRSQRAPSAAELLSFGPHIGTRSYEVGALFSLDKNGENIGLTSASIELETAQNIDLSFRKTQGDLAIIVNAFYNQVDDYYFQVATGLYAEDGHSHHDHAHAHNEASELPVYLFQSDDVILHGFEAQVVWQANEHIKATFFGDLVRGRLADGGDLPRTPPIRFGSSINYQVAAFNAHLDITRYQTQDKVASLETPTPGYTLVNAGLSYQLPFTEHDISIYGQVKNLTDSYAQVHSSFVKDIAPRQGRSLAIGLRAYF